MPRVDDLPRPQARVLSWLGDWAVVAGWLLLLGLLSFLLRGGWPSSAAEPPAPTALLLADLLVLVATVVPFLLYLVLTEASTQHASLGKRWNGLAVRALAGGPPSLAAVWTRNVVKVLPWQLAHLAVSRFIFGVQLPAAIVLDVLALVLLALVAVPALTGGQGLHDRLAGTVVREASP